MTERDALAALHSTDLRTVARAEALLWELWTRSGVPELDALMQEGISAVEGRDFDEAERCFTRIIAQAPEFAEGWNKRATLRYLAGDHAGAIEDCQATLARKPHHFGALSGQGLCHLALGQPREAAALFRRALEVHPHLAAVRRNLAAAQAEAVKGNGH